MSVELAQAELPGADGPDPGGSGREVRRTIVGSVLAEIDHGRERAGRAALTPDIVASLVDEEYARCAHAGPGVRAGSGAPRGTGAGGTAILTSGRPTTSGRIDSLPSDSDDRSGADLCHCSGRRRSSEFAWMRSSTRSVSPERFRRR